MSNLNKIIEEIEEVEQSANGQIDQQILNLDQLEHWRIIFLGRNGEISKLMKYLSSVSDENKRIIGPKINNLKKSLSNKYNLTQKKIDQRNNAVTEFDFTLPGRPVNLGNYHPTTLIIREICTAFSEMGFQIIEGQEIETEKYNFDLLNIPNDHPARDQWDTIWLQTENTNVKHLLRTHTSPMQARVMEKNNPPLRVIIPGKCYRYEATDATHEWQFHQIEGLAVDKNISFSELKGTLFEMARKLFGTDQKVRFRCDFFPFVEPGVDMSIEWNGKWIEILGAGMVHPKVLEGVGYNPKEYSGFAFGLGPERISMLKNKISDIRNFHLNDLRFLNQFTI
ncbi:MAG: phenylalanine--tRNA ligase subunit alpha [Chloroflexi bacterium]|uniref:Phenylalanine--tRNA ligase alpha subunit n=1 Tax=marine metagenome TaxID=408172 RepID=A0A382EDR7_9ZZZZ|nr:phenylalanine--tRNA ligase subunit alpha [Chloroflexota bacterium]